MEKADSSFSNKHNVLKIGVQHYYKKIAIGQTKKTPRDKLTPEF